MLYGQFLDANGPLLGRVALRPGGASGRAFADYVRVLTDWRRLPYLDPGLPGRAAARELDRGPPAAELFLHPAGPPPPGPPPPGSREGRTRAPRGAAVISG